VEDYYLSIEGIRVLPYEITTAPKAKDGDKPEKDHGNFDAWLEALWEQTAPTQRLRRLFLPGDKSGAERDCAPVVWYDPELKNNTYGVQIFHDAGVVPDQLENLGQLTRERCGQARLILTRFGFDRDNPKADPDAIRLLKAVNKWGERPPVIVFAEDGDWVAANRDRVLAHGAFEFTTNWDELFQTIERLLGPQVCGGTPTGVQLR
jgi:hypothetical protein